jgi:thymidylate synthase
MNNLDKQYTNLLQDILDNGVTKQDRTGTGTLSVFGRQIRHKMSDGFPLLTTKKIPFRLVATELLWFLRGDTNIKFLVDNDCHIWDGDAYKAYLKGTERFGKKWQLDKEEFINQIKNDDEFAKKWGDLGPVYGKQWRNWTKFEDESKEHNEWYISSEPIDQIANLINDLKTNPDSRRLMVNAWNVGELDSMVLPPCHYGFQVYTRELSLEEKEWQLEKTNCINDIETDRIIYGQEWEKYIEEQYEGIESTQGIKIPTRAISLMWNQRSVDTFLGLPFNIASYGLLLEIIAKEVNMIPDELIGNLGDTHLYLNHIEQAKEQIGRKLDLDERRAMVTQEMFNQIYNAGDSSILTHSEIDQFDIPRVKTREPYSLPKLFFKYEKETYVDNYELDGFILKDYQSHPHIKAPLSN